MKYFILLMGLVATITACTNNQPPDQALLRAEVINAEKEFTQMAADSGIAAAFIFFAADSAVLLRGDEIVKGIDKIRDYVNRGPESGVKLVWSPDFVDVSSSGDLGYTYGKYSYTVSDSLGVSQTAEGYFHTVWKKQSDGKWKYVWD